MEGSCYAGLMKWNGYSYFRERVLAGGPEANPGYRFGSLPEHVRCSARAKSTGERCQSPRVAGKKTCRLHGSGNKKLSRAAMLRRAARLRGERPPHYTCD